MSDPKSFRVNLITDQGASFSSNITLFDSLGVQRDTTGWQTANAFIRKWFTSNTYVQLSSNLVSNGILNLSLTANQTANIVFGKYVYDVFCIDSNNNSIKVVEGLIFIEPSASINPQPLP